MSDAPIRVLLVDDHRLVRTGFQMILTAEDDIEVVGEAENGADAIAAAAELAPDVVCMDVQMPVMDGIDATRRIVEERAGATRVLMLTTFHDDAAVQASLRAGASGFVLKNSPPETLVDAIRVVHQGDALLDPQVTKSVISAAVREAAAPAGEAAASEELPAPDVTPAEGAPARDATPSGAAPAQAASPAHPALDALTEREREVLLLLAEGHSNAAIATRMYVSAATIKTHVSNLLAKLGVHDRIHAVIFAYEHGVVGASGTSASSADTAD